MLSQLASSPGWFIRFGEADPTEPKLALGKGSLILSGAYCSSTGVIPHNRPVQCSCPGVRTNKLELEVNSAVIFVILHALLKSQHRSRAVAKNVHPVVTAVSGSKQ